MKCAIDYESTVSLCFASQKWDFVFDDRCTMRLMDSRRVQWSVSDQQGVVYDQVKCLSKSTIWNIKRKVWQLRLAIKMTTSDNILLFMNYFVLLKCIFTVVDNGDQI